MIHLIFQKMNSNLTKRFIVKVGLSNKCCSTYGIISFFAMISYILIATEILKIIIILALKISLLLLTTQDGGLGCLILFLMKKTHV